MTDEKYKKIKAKIDAYLDECHERVMRGMRLVKKDRPHGKGESPKQRHSRYYRSGGVLGNGSPTGSLIKSTRRKSRQFRRLEDELSDGCVDEKQTSSDSKDVTRE